MKRSIPERLLLGYILAFASCVLGLLGAPCEIGLSLSLAALILIETDAIIEAIREKKQ
jgi:hypothetical protein